MKQSVGYSLLVQVDLFLPSNQADQTLLVLPEEKKKRKENFKFPHETIKEIRLNDIKHVACDLPLSLWSVHCCRTQSGGTK